MDRSKIFWNIEKKEEEKEAIITLYGTIGSNECSDDVVDKHIRNTLNSLKDYEKIKLYVNSPGGSVMAATSIYNALKNHKAFIEVYVDGIAASSATIITCAGDKVYMPNNTMFMVHNPMTVASGSSKDFNKTADVLDKVKETILNTYVSKTGQEKEILSQLMDDESWLSAEEALEYGFIDEILVQNASIENMGEKLIVNSIVMDISSFKNNPFKNTVVNSAETPKKISKEPGNMINEEENMTKAELKEKFPDIYNEIYKEGEQGERERIKNIEENAPSGFDDLVVKAKYADPVNYEQLAVNIVREQQEREKIQNKVNAEKLENIQKENGEGLEKMEPKKEPENKDKGIAENILNFIKGGK